MKNQKSNFVKGVDPLTSLNIGTIQIIEKWLDHYGLTYDKKSITRSKGDAGQAIIELTVDTDISATIREGNPDYKPGRTGSVRITFEIGA